MSLADWVCAVALCFEPEREGDGLTPPALSRFLHKRKAAALPPAGQSQTLAEAAPSPFQDFAGALDGLAKTLSKAEVLGPQRADPPPGVGKISKRAFQTVSLFGIANWSRTLTP